MIKEWSDEAWEEFLEQVKKDRNFLKRIEKILKRFMLLDFLINM